jgi:two-component system, LytTR family, response regulator
MTLSVLIADDEALARRRLRRLLARESGVEIVAESRNGREALRDIETHAPALVFLDVQMPELDGFGVLASLDPERMPAIVFVTAYDEYAVRAFEVHALDYLLKPFSESRFRAAFRRAKSFLSEPDGGAAPARILALLERLSAEGSRGANAGYLRRILVRTNGRVIFVRASDVDWVEAAGNYVKLHVGSDALLVRTTLAVIGDRLDPAGFARIHRSTIVNMDRVREMQPWFSGDSILILQSGTKLRVSRTYRERLERQLDPAPATSREGPS